MSGDPHLAQRKYKKIGILIYTINEYIYIHLIIMLLDADII